METLQSLVGTIIGWAWGPPMLVIILGVGLFLQVGLKFMPIRNLGYGFRQHLFDRYRFDGSDWCCDPWRHHPHRQCCR